MARRRVGMRHDVDAASRNAMPRFARMPMTPTPTRLATIASAAFLLAAAPAAAQSLRIVTATDSVTLDRAALAALPQDTATIVPHRHGAAPAAPVRITGPALATVLARAGVRTDSLRGAALATTALATARDGYRVAFSLGELGADLGRTRVLVAIAADGRALGESDGPLRLVVPGDGRQARWVRQLERIVVRAP